MTLATSFACTLKQRRKMLDLTQQELAQQVGCATVTIQRIEQGTLRPSRQIAQRLADILDIPAEERKRFMGLARGGSMADAPTPHTHPDDAPGGLLSRSALPAPLTSLIGRGREVAAVCEALQGGKVRLLTLTGPGGIGKTRLALQVAIEMEPVFADGVVFVDLAPIPDPNLVPTAIARALGLLDMDGQPPSVRLQAALRDKHLLLVLDNFEHVVAAAPVVAELLAAAPRLTVLLTSRVVVGMYGEHTFPVPPLTLPELKDRPPLDQLMRVETVRLFVERAQAVKPDFRLTSANAPAVCDICHHLDGLPLSLELAAARVRLLPPQALLHHITQRTRGRLEMLTGGPRTLATRQQSLRDTIAWSYDLLDPHEQRLFRRLAVFVGGCTLEAVQAVCDVDGDLTIDALEGLAALLDHSLLQQWEDRDGEPRFSMLETIREYALEQLSDSSELEALRRHHAAFFVSLAETAEPALSRPHQMLWLDRLEVEHPNLRAALRWSQTETSGETGLRLAAALSHFWASRGHLSEGRGWLAGALRWSEAGVAGRPPTQAHLILRAKALRWAGQLASWQVDRAAAQPLLEECLALFHQLHDTVGIADALGLLGMWFQIIGDQGQAIRLLEESLILYRQVEDTEDIRGPLFFLGTVAWAQGNYDRAGVLFEESLSLYRKQGDIWMIATTLGYLGMVNQKQSNNERANARLAESLTLYQQVGDRWGITLVLEGIGTLTAVQGQRSEDAQPSGLRAARIFGAAEALRETLGAPLFPSHRAHYQHGIAAARAQLDDTVFAAAWAEGRAMTLEQAIAYALDGEHPASLA